MQGQLLQLLQSSAGLSEEDFESAVRQKQEKGGYTGEILVQKKAITEAELLGALSIEYDIPFWSELPLDNIGLDFTRQVPIQFLKKHHMIPLTSTHEDADPEDDSPGGDEGNGDAPSPARGAVIAMNNPAAFQALDDLVRILGLGDYEVVLSTREAILSAIDRSYDLSQGSAEQIVQDMEEDDSITISGIEATADLLDDTSDAPIIKLVNQIISDSAKRGSSDIHIESYQDNFKVRYRVDGKLYDLLSPGMWMQPAVISRIKIMAGMDIAESRRPQDGRLPVRRGGQEIDVRVSTMPTSFGERVVLRLLDRSDARLELSEIGLDPEGLDLVRKVVAFTNGIILVTGPTGSGKTTTLYAILRSINTPDKNIITVEDPIEYQIEGISQMPVNPKIGLTFASALRSIVRQDPDVILVGEIRDLETAETAVQSALTGHLVFSTVHTNDSATTITRLVDLGVEPFLISSSIIAVIAQRLVRRLCEHCKEPVTPDEMMLQTVGITPDQVQGSSICRPKGCGNCLQGYRSRIGIFETMEMEETLKGLILKTYDSNRIRREAMKLNMVTLRQDGIRKVLRGITTIEEVLGVTQM